MFITDFLSALGAYYHRYCKCSKISNTFLFFSPGCVAQLVTCLATDACLTADPGVASSIPARYHTLRRLIMK